MSGRAASGGAGMTGGSEALRDERDALAAWADGYRAQGRSWSVIGELLVGMGRTPEERERLRGMSGTLARCHDDWKRRTGAEEKGREARERSLDESAAAGMGMGTGPGYGVAPGTEDAGDGDAEENAGESDLSPSVGGAAGEDLGKVLRYLARGLVRQRRVWRFHCHRTLRPGETWEDMAGPGSLATVEWLERGVVIRRADGGVAKIYPECRVRRTKSPGWRRTLRPTLEIERLTLPVEDIAKTERELAAARRAVERTPAGSGKKRRAAEKRVTALETRLARKRARAESEGTGETLDVGAVVSRLAAVMEHYELPETGIRHMSHLADLTDRTKQAVSDQRKTLTRDYRAGTGGRAGFKGQRTGKPRGKTVNQEAKQS